MSHAQLPGRFSRKQSGKDMEFPSRDLGAADALPESRNYRASRTVRSATLLGYQKAATTAGLDYIAMLRRVGIDPSCMQDLDSRISIDAFGALLALSATEAGCRSFGARAAIARGIPDYGLTSVVMNTAVTAEEAVNLYTSHLILHADASYISLEKQLEFPFINLEMPGNTAEEIYQTTQFAMIGVTRQLRWLTGGKFQPKLLCFQSKRPFGAAMTFGDCEIVYNASCSGIVVSHAALQHRVVISKPPVQLNAVPEISFAFSNLPNGFVSAVRQIVKQLLPEGRCSSEAVASQFGVDRRTLNRRLEREGETFSSIVQAVRVDAARRALSTKQCSLTEISDIVGFDSLSSFSRWFRTSFGSKASSFRETFL